MDYLELLDMHRAMIAHYISGDNDAALYMAQQLVDTDLDESRIEYVRYIIMRLT